MKMLYRRVKEIKRKKTKKYIITYVPKNDYSIYAGNYIIEDTQTKYAHRFYTKKELNAYILKRYKEKGI